MCTRQSTVLSKFHIKIVPFSSSGLLQVQTLHSNLDYCTCKIHPLHVFVYIVYISNFHQWKCNYSSIYAPVSGEKNATSVNCSR